jgi:hypothetical protein
MPKLNHGWSEDSWLDVVAVEVGTGWDTTFGTKELFANALNASSL